MSNDDSGLDLVGLGKFAKAIPSAVWKRTVETACQTFEKCLAPLTEATSGLGRLIAAKFDRLTELEKINASAAFERAKAKIEESGREPIAEIQAKVIVATLEGAAMETNEELRELWANLLTHEFTRGKVHPQIPQILSQLTTEDAQTLAKIKPLQVRDKLAGLLGQNPRLVTIPIVKKIRKETLSEAVLFALGLARKDGLRLELTALGTAFIEAVQDPSPQGDAVA